MGVIVEMLELAYLTNILQLLRQRSQNLEEMISESRRAFGRESIRYRSTNLHDRFSRRNDHYEQDVQEQEPLRLAHEFRPPSFRMSNRHSQSDVSVHSSGSTDPLDFNHFMDDVYRMFPFN